MSSKAGPPADVPRDPALDQLDPLVGEWDVEATHPLLSGIVRGKASFEWLPGRRFLIWRSSAPPGTIPSALSVLGGGDVRGVWPMHYFDERGVTRVFEARMRDGVLSISREHPGFSQRLTFTVDADGTTLHMGSELDRDGTWKADLEATYRRAGTRER